MSERFKCPAAVNAIFIKDNKILLLKRKDKMFNGIYTFPSGHVEGNERIVDAAIREAKEEVGIHLQEQDLEFATLYHSHIGGNEYMHFYYIVKNWSGEFKNCEPEICEALEFHPIDNLPKTIWPTIPNAIENIKKGNTFFEDNFPF